MLLRAKLIPARPCALALVALSCDASTAGCEDTRLPVPGVEVYARAQESSGEALRLYLDQAERIQLARVDEDGQLIAGGRVEATLTPDALALLDAAAAELESGGSPGSFDPQCLGFVDSATVRMVVQASQSRLEFGYPWQCAPSALAPLDDMFQELTLALPECSPSAFYTDCSAID